MPKMNIKFYTPENTTIAAYRVFETLKYLIKHPANVQDIVNYLESLEINEEKGFSKAVVYKYLTTLKFAGIKLIRNKCKYEVENLPFKIDFDEDSLKALAILNNIVETIPEKYLSKEIMDFFYQLKMRYSLNCEMFEEKKKIIKETINISEPTAEQAQVLREYEAYCKDQFRLKITYCDLYGEVQSSIFEPLEVKFEDNQVLFLLFNTKSNTFFEFYSKGILDISPTPLKCSNKFFAGTTVFKLKGKLAKRYTLRNDEQSMGLDADGVLTVMNKKESKTRLFLRLMRYAYNCEVVTSKKDRAEMLNMIENTLNNYEGT